MKTVSSKSQALDLDAQIHLALKRHYGFAKPITDGQFYETPKGEVQINWTNSGLDHLKINTSEGSCYVSYTVKPDKDRD
ncbi:hypothetical protein [Spirosoma sordidisoli]|uniref:Uncharacterized protein n=1 Tax=Spirosoma sordidisoli TaxID=2502893 RepID=A0A4Q2USL9_9BACT|nr:hypothetical protein [Spirosoma sordidisoli]RYC70720.1 hypothetical protein EQG79_00780 [Spirosoma sordidisoli]